MKGALLVAVLAVATVFAVPSFADDSLKEGVTVIRSSGVSGGVSVRAEVRVAIGSTCHGWRWGAEGGCPHLMLSELRVVLGETEFFVPLSAVVDLGEPRRLSIVRRTANFDVVIRGGDAGTAYKAVLTFSDAVLKKRRVTHGEFSKSAWEETIYSVPN